MEVNKIHRIKIIILCMCGMLLVGCSGKEDNIELGMLAIEDLRYEEALDIFAKELEVTREKEIIYRGQGLAHMGLSNYEEATNSFELALENSMKEIGNIDYDINYYLATSMYRTGDLVGAIERYSAIIQLKEGETQAYLLRGSVRLKNNEYDMAIVDFEKAIELAPIDYQMLIHIYMALEKSGYKEEGALYLEEALGSSEVNMKDHEKGMIYYYLGEYESARDSLEIGKKEGGEDAILLLGKSYEALGDKNYAVTVYKTYLEGDAESVSMLNQLALCQMELGNYKDALSAVQQAIAIENNQMMQTLKYNEIVIYEFLEDFEKAARLMDSYIVSYPDDHIAQREYEFLKTR